jgi:hypothetical protein
MALGGREGRRPRHPPHAPGVPCYCSYDIRTGAERLLAKNGSGMQVPSLSPSFRLHSSKLKYPHWTRELTVSCT